MTRCRHAQQLVPCLFSYSLCMTMHNPEKPNVHAATVNCCFLLIFIFYGTTHYKHWYHFSKKVLIWPRRSNPVSRCLCSISILTDILFLNHVYKKEFIEKKIKFILMIFMHQKISFMISDYENNFLFSEKGVNIIFTIENFTLKNIFLKKIH